MLICFSSSNHARSIKTYITSVCGEKWKFMPQMSYKSKHTSSKHVWECTVSVNSFKSFCLRVVSQGTETTARWGGAAAVWGDLPHPPAAGQWLLWESEQASTVVMLCTSLSEFYLGTDESNIPVICTSVDSAAGIRFRIKSVTVPGHLKCLALQLHNHECCPICSVDSVGGNVPAPKKPICWTPPSPINQSCSALHKIL